MCTELAIPVMLYGSIMWTVIQTHNHVFTLARVALPQLPATAHTPKMSPSSVVCKRLANRLMHMYTSAVILLSA